MKKHIILTTVLLLVFTALLCGVLVLRDQMGEPLSAESLANNAGQKPPETGAEDIIEENGRQTEEEKGNTPAVEPAGEETETDMTQQAQDTTLVFTGDVLFANSFQNSYGAGGITGVLSESLQTELTQADLTVVNQEFPFSTRGTPMEDKQYTFRADPKYVSALSEMGVDLVTLANNHILDYGREALEDTFTTLQNAGIPYMGAGRTAEEARALHSFTVNGRTYGFLAASRVIQVEDWNVDNHAPGVFTTYDGTALCEEIKKASAQCDHVTVYVHWGVEHDAYPQAYQTTLAKQYIDAGADLVIGAHTHCLQGVEFYQGKPIFYSLGNFIFGSSIDRTMALRVTVDADGNASYRLIPAYASNGCTMQMEPQNASALYRYMEEISTGVTIGENGELQNAAAKTAQE